MSARRERPFDRTVKLLLRERVLLVDGDDELFIEQTPRGVKICDARGFDLRVEFPNRAAAAGEKVTAALIRKGRR